ncbi:MAG TPA: cytochrome P450 [Mycobacteriales bacterium]|nr:cytochrome P450 [Mycobacteriales bacterium]
MSGGDKSAVDEIDFFRSGAVLADPYPYYEQLRGQCPVHREPHEGVVMITGYDEALEVYRDAATFSSANSVTGPFPGFSVPLVGEDVTALIEAHRDELPFSDQLPTFDPPKHGAHRGLTMRMLTPKRLKENEAAIWEIADRQLDEFIDEGGCEFVSAFASPFAMLVIADLLGVPDDDRPEFRDRLARTSGFGTGESNQMAHTPLEFLYDKFSRYIEDRRREPRADIMTRMAGATFPDGSTPEVLDVVRVAANLFAAGQETTVRLLASALRIVAEHPDIQDALRADPTAIPNFVEEVLRVESPIKGDFRVARVGTTVGGVDIPAGTTVMLLNGAANRDPRRFDDPAALDPARANAREHLAFGHGTHFCPGAPLARTEGRVALERILHRTSKIRIDADKHGPEGQRKFRFVPTYMLRGLVALHLTFEPAR